MKLFTEPLGKSWRNLDPGDRHSALGKLIYPILFFLRPKFNTIVNTNLLYPFAIFGGNGVNFALLKQSIPNQYQ